MFDGYVRLLFQHAAGGGAIDLPGEQGEFDEPLAGAAMFLGQFQAESAELGRQAPERGSDVLCC